MNNGRRVVHCNFRSCTKCVDNCRERRSRDLNAPVDICRRLTSQLGEVHERQAHVNPKVRESENSRQLRGTRRPMLDGIGNRPELLNGRSSHLFVGLPVSSDMGAMSERPDR